MTIFNSTPKRMETDGLFPDPGRGAAITDAALSLCALGGGHAILLHQATPAAGDQPLDGDFILVRDVPGAEDTVGERKHARKPGDPRRDTSVKFDEMIRLMKVYGPIKCQRDKRLHDAVKPGSVRRKFYRWFPDFAQRFERTEHGRFAPRAGHELEMQYREGLRRKDEEKVKSMRAMSRKRDTRVPFEEMRRLMRVYGPIKCERQRTPKQDAVKPDSLRRKFCRWFPDFLERFEKTPEGCFAPRAGHWEEMRHREELRREDQWMVTAKRIGSKISIVG